MTDRTPMQRALDRDTEIEELARENERLRDALATIRKGTEMSKWKEHDGGPQPEETVGRLVEYEISGGTFKWERSADEVLWNRVSSYRLLDTPFDTPPSDEEKIGIHEPIDEYTKTLRDEFAMAALPCVARINDWGTFNFKSVSTDAYALADAMLAARKEK